MNNQLADDMLEVLAELRNSGNCAAIKAEFEAEGSRTSELIMLCNVVRRANLPLTIKIGGCEAARDMDQAKLFDSEAIMAPMIETPYAMRKYRLTAEKIFGSDIGRINWIINAETVTCQENLEAILDEGEGFLKSVCIGRSDLSGSLGLSKEINGSRMFEAVKDIAVRSRDRGLSVTFGGKIMPDSIGFVSEMASFVDAYETRKVTFKSGAGPAEIKRNIETALRFESLYLQAKNRYYENMAGEDRERLLRFGRSL